MCLAGEYLSGPVARNAFPTREFRVFVNRVTGMVYGIESEGMPLDSWPVYGDFAYGIDGFVDGRLYEKSMAEILDLYGGNIIRRGNGASDA